MKTTLLRSSALAALAIATPLMFAVATPAYAQQITSSIEGTVTDADGAPLPNATVTVTDTRTGAARTMTTSAGGTFSATGLVTGGPYTVAATADGFEGQTISGINTTLQGSTSLTFALTSGTGEIVVSGARVKLTQLAVGPGQSFTSEILEAAPSYSRDVRDIIRLDPRVSLDRDDGGSGQDRISCLGGNDRGNAFTVDGIAQGDVFGLNDTGFSSRSSTPIPYDAIRETQVQFAPFDVEFGQFTGCAINVVTKSGSNKIHGGAFFEYSDNGLRGKNVAGIKVAPIKPDKHWGATLGGAVIPDKLFVFGAYEHQESGLSQEEGPSGGDYGNPMSGVSVAQFNEITQVLRDQYGIDSGPLVYSRNYKNDRYFGRVDWQISDRHRFEATYQKLKETTLKPDDLFVGSSPQAVGKNTFYLSGTDSEYYSGRLYSDWTDTFSTELRYAHTHVQDIQDPFGGGEAQLGSPIPRIIVGIDNATGNDGAVEVGPGRSRTANDLRTTISYYRAVAKLDAGAHKLKFGLEANRAKLYNVFIQDATGTLVFRNINDLRNGLLSPGTTGTTSTTPSNIIPGRTVGAFGNFSATGDANDAAAIFNRNIYTAYAQDDWEVTDRLKAVIGARIDLYEGEGPTYNPNFQKRFGFPNNTGFGDVGSVFTPRLGLTYDLDDFAVFSRTQLHGGVGIFSGGDPLVWFSNAFSNTGGNIALGTTASAGCPSGQIKVTDASGKFTGVPQCIVNAGSASAALFQGNAQAVDPDIKMPTVLRANFGISTNLDFAEDGFFHGWNLAADFIWSHYRNPFNVVDLSQAVNPAKGLNGYTVDGRPIYGTIDPLRPGCAAALTERSPVPTYSNVTAACFAGVPTSYGAFIMLTNAGSYNSKVASALINKTFDGGIFTKDGSVYVSLGYAYTDAHDRRNMYNSTAGSNYGQTAAFDRQNPAASTGFFQSRHNISAGMSFTEEFFGDYRTKLNITYVGRAGRPYSLTFAGNGVFNPTNGGLTTSDAALLYLPSGVNDTNISPGSNMAAVQDLVDWASKAKCAKKYLGSSIPRNTCTNAWYNDVDLSFSQEIPGPGRLFGVEDKIKVFISWDNFLNFLDKDWNVQRRRNFFGVQDVASISGVDAQGRYIISGFNGADAIANDKGINFSSSVWRAKIGVSYDF
jgi:hypothetical protein